MATPMVSTALTANENIVTQLNAGSFAYPYAPTSSTAGGIATFADTTGGRLSSTTKPNLLVNVVASGGATPTLTASQSGSTMLFDTATGVTYTLPAPSVGLVFDFVTSVSVTSNSYKIITSGASIYLVGAISYGILDTTPGANPGPKFTAANGSSHVAITMNGSTTGGLQGTWVRLTCISATLWNIEGLVIGSGTISTPFATS